MIQPVSSGQVRATDAREYADRLVRLQRAPWKRWLQVQAPFRWNLRRLRPGVTLEVGCGIGRNLRYLDEGSVGVDTNEHCVRLSRDEGLTAFTPEDFEASPGACPSGGFDTLLLAHVVEHMTGQEASALVRRYAPYVRRDGRLILLAPQEAGFSSDPTHVQMMDVEALTRIARAGGFEPERCLSFPFPRWVGRFFVFNEFVVVARKRGAAGAQ